MCVITYGRFSNSFTFLSRLPFSPTCIFRPGKQNTFFMVFSFWPSCVTQYHFGLVLRERFVCSCFTKSFLVFWYILILKVEYILGLFFSSSCSSHNTLSHCFIAYSLPLSFCSFCFKMKCSERFHFPTYYKTDTFTKLKQLSSAVVSTKSSNAKQLSGRRFHAHHQSQQ